MNLSYSGELVIVVASNIMHCSSFSGSRQLIGMLKQAKPIDLSYRLVPRHLRPLNKQSSAIACLCSLGTWHQMRLPDIPCIGRAARQATNLYV